MLVLGQRAVALTRQALNFNIATENVGACTVPPVKLRSAKERCRLQAADRAGVPWISCFHTVIKDPAKKYISLHVYRLFVLSFVFSCCHVDGGCGSIQKSITGIASPKLQTQSNPHVAPASRESVICARMVWFFSGNARRSANKKVEYSNYRTCDRVRSLIRIFIIPFWCCFMQIAFYQTRIPFNAFTFW